jgi:serine/threonine protein kinase
MSTRRPDPESTGAAPEPAGTGPTRDDTLAGDGLDDFFDLIRCGTSDSPELTAHRAAVIRALAGGLPGRVADQAGDDPPPTRADGPAAEGTAPPSRLGDFSILREVGRGGMGVVYEAEQVPLGRRVALKVLSAAATLDPRQRQRFLVEAQAAALLRHEHIVPVFGFGSDRGVYYYAMAFIDGSSLAEVIRGRRGPAHAGPAAPAAAGHPGPPESGGRAREWFRTAAGYGLQAAEALEHAHEMGVIHRDIKPSNLLVDARGHLWVADFGLARIAQEDPGLTRTGDVIGTLRYMCPEQARGGRAGADPRADVYALGATLYELLTFRPAFRADDREELLHRLFTEEPVAPRRVDRAIPRDLETVVLKAMAKEPSARYGSAREMGDDLRRFLDDRPIRGRRPGLLGRSARWARRHRATAAAAVTTLVLALSVSTALLWQANRRTTAARVQQTLAFQLSLGTIDQIIQSLADGAAGDPPSGRGPAERASRLAVAFYDRIAETFADDEVMREVVAKALRSAGRERLSRGLARGREDYRRSIRAYEEVAARHPGFIWLRTGLIETMQEYAGMLAEAGDGAEADAVFRRALAVAEGVIGEKDAGLPCFSHGLIGPLEGLAWGLVTGPRPRPGDAARAVRLARRAAEWGPGRSGPWRALGAAHYRAGDWAAASAALERSMALSGGGDPLDWSLMAAVRGRQGDAAEARQWYDRAATGVRRAGDRDEELRRFLDEAGRLSGRPDGP